MNQTTSSTYYPSVSNETFLSFLFFIILRYIPYPTPTMMTTIRAIIMMEYHFSPVYSYLLANETLIWVCSEEYSLVATRLMDSKLPGAL